MFTSSEYFEMLVLYGQCDESATVAAQEYVLSLVSFVTLLNKLTFVWSKVFMSNTIT
jgi:hypothetical protein